MTEQISAGFWYSRKDVEPMMCSLVDTLEACHAHIGFPREEGDAEMLAAIEKAINEAYETGVLDNRPRYLPVDDHIVEAADKVEGAQAGE